MRGGRGLLTYWYYYLPDFALAALLYTLLGRVLLSLFVEPDSTNYIWRFFCRLTDPFVDIVALVSPRAVVPVVLWLFGVVWLFWLRVLLLVCLSVLGLLPRAGGGSMERHWYYIGIAFFGMISGMFSPLELRRSPMSRQDFMAVPAVRQRDPHLLRSLP